MRRHLIQSCSHVHVCGGRGHTGGHEFVDFIWNQKNNRTMERNRCWTCSSVGPVVCMDGGGDRDGDGGGDGDGDRGGDGGGDRGGDGAGTCEVSEGNRR